MTIISNYGIIYKIKIVGCQSGYYFMDEIIKEKIRLFKLLLQNGYQSYPKSDIELINRFLLVGYNSLSQQEQLKIDACIKFDASKFVHQNNTEQSTQLSEEDIYAKKIFETGYSSFTEYEKMQFDKFASPTKSEYDNFDSKIYSDSAGVPVSDNEQVNKLRKKFFEQSEYVYIGKGSSQWLFSIIFFCFLFLMFLVSIASAIIQGKNAGEVFAIIAFGFVVWAIPIVSVLLILFYSNRKFFQMVKVGDKILYSLYYSKRKHYFFDGVNCVTTHTKKNVCSQTKKGEFKYKMAYFRLEVIPFIDNLNIRQKENEILFGSGTIDGIYKIRLTVSKSFEFKKFRLSVWGGGRRYSSWNHSYFAVKEKLLNDKFYLPTALKQYLQNSNASYLNYPKVEFLDNKVFDIVKDFVAQEKKQSQYNSK